MVRGPQGQAPPPPCTLSLLRKIFSTGVDTVDFESQTFSELTFAIKAVPALSGRGGF